MKALILVILLANSLSASAAIYKLYSPSYSPVGSYSVSDEDSWDVSFYNRHASLQHIGVAWRIYGLYNQTDRLSILSEEGDFKLTAYIDNIFLGESIIRDTLDTFIHEGGFISEAPLDLDGRKRHSITFQLSPYEGFGNPANQFVSWQSGGSSIFYSTGGNVTFEYNDKYNYIQVPEPETFALFLLGAVGLCVRRQIKANATLPV